MAIVYDSSYSATGTDDTDANYPGGKGVNASSESALDGFPAKAERSNDLLGFVQWLIRFGSRGRVQTKAQYVAEISGTPDNSVSSDYGEGLKAIMNPIHPDVLEYSAATNYVFGDLVQSYGSQYLCLVANGPASSVQNPVADVYADYWYELPSENWMRQQAQVIRPFMLGIKPVFDYNDGTYQMIFPFGIFRKGNQKIEYFCVIHDDSNIIAAADGNVFNAMAQGTKGATIASLSGGEYTMIDGQDCVISAMGDNRPASFGRQEDQFQGFDRYNGVADDGGNNPFVYGTTTNDMPGLAPNGLGSFSGSPVQQGFCSDPVSDGTNETPRVGSETRGKSLLGGPLAQIVAYTTAI